MECAPFRSRIWWEQVKNHSMSTKCLPKNPLRRKALRAQNALRQTSRPTFLSTRRICRIRNPLGRKGLPLDT